MLTCFVYCLAALSPAGLLFGEELPPVENAQRLIPNARVLFQSIVRKGDGNYLVYQRIEPPPAPPPVPVVPQVQASPEALAAMQATLLPVRNVIMTAQVYDGSLTELCWTHEGKKCVAWSSVDFRLLGGGVDVMAGGVRHSFMALTQVTTPAQHAAQQSAAALTGGSPAAWPAFPAETLASVPAGMTAWYALVAFEGTVEEEDAACAPLEALHAFIEANRAELVAKQAEREALAAAEAARKAAEPKGPKTTVIQFWREEVPAPASGANSNTNGEVQP
jgi:hypothetical protein